MKVKELLELLKSADPNARVFIQIDDDDESFAPVEDCYESFMVIEDDEATGYEVDSEDEDGAIKAVLLTNGI